MREEDLWPKVIENPVTGDRLEFLSSPLHGDAGPLEFLCELAPNSKGSPLHFHRTIAETFRVERGLLEMQIGEAGVYRTLFEGEQVAIAPGTLHSFRNPLNEKVTFVSSATPGKGFEKFLRAMYGLAADGQTNADGMPTDPRALALTLRYADLVVPNLPQGFQTLLVGTLVGLAKLTRLEEQFERYWPKFDVQPATVERC